MCILGSQEPRIVQDFCSKLFDNCKVLKFTKTDLIQGMTSEEDEEFEFNDKTKPDGKVEFWLNKVEIEMISSLKKLVKAGVYNYSKQKKEEWIMEHLGMVVIASETVWWTWRIEDTFRKIVKGDKKAMKNEFEKQNIEMDELTDLLVATTDKQLRKKLNIMITVNVHSRDIVGGFVRDSILNEKEFQWESQLRF